MKIGYARVSTEEQNLDLQRRALNAAGVDRIHEDRVSGLAVKRPGLEAALASLGSGDTLVVWRLDRLGRSLPHLISIVQELGDRDVGFQSLSESIDTTTAGGRLVFHIMGALAEFERSLIVERTRRSAFAHAVVDPLLALTVELPRDAIVALGDRSVDWPADLRRRWTYAAAAGALGTFV